MNGAPHHRISVVEPGSRFRIRGATRCLLTKDVGFRYSQLERFCWSRLEEIDLDVLFVAGAVAFADRVSRRTFSNGWSRTIELDMPVSDPFRWEAREVKARLRTTLEYVTGDRWEFSFRHRRWRDESALQRFLPRAPVSEQRVVLPYSGGLDSFAEFMRLRADQPNVLPILMTTEHGGGVARKVSGDGSTGRGIGQVSMPVRLKPGEHAEATYRTRTFLFFSVAALGAKLAGAETVNVAEAGQGALGVAMVPYGAEHPYLTTHPSFTELLRKFLAALWGWAPSFEHPNIWGTKGELLATLASRSALAGWQETRSCARNVKRLKPGVAFDHCGICGGCLLRRMSLKAAGLDETAESTYAWSDYGAVDLEQACSAALKTTQNDREIATYALLSHEHLAQLAVDADGAGDVSRAAVELGPLVGSVSEARRRLIRLLKAHRQEWKNYVSEFAIGGWAERLIRGG